MEISDPETDELSRTLIKSVSASPTSASSIPAPTEAAEPSSAPPPVVQEVLDVPPSWFQNSRAKEVYLGLVKSKGFSAYEIVDFDFFLGERFEMAEKLVNSNCGILMNVGNTYYPRLVRLFYANLVKEETQSGLMFVSRVKNVVIKMDAQELTHILQAEWNPNPP